MNNEEESKEKAFRRSFLKKHFILEKSKLLGKGGFGEVYAIPEKTTKNVYALKVINPSRDSFKKRTKELSILLNLDEHPHIVQLKDYFCDSYKNQIFLVMEKADETLSSILEKRPFLSLEDLKQMTIEITKGLQHAHSKGISHSDLKPSNILVFNKIGETVPVNNKINKQITFKISDWGSSHFLGPLVGKTFDNKTQCDYSLGYTDPNILSKNPKNFGKSDIYSLGMVIMRACGVLEDNFVHLSEIKNKQDHEKQLKELLRKYEVEKKYGDKIIQLIEKMTKFNQNERLKIDEILIYFEDNEDIQKKENKFDLFADEIKEKIAPHTVNFIYDLYNEFQKIGWQMIPILSGILERQMMKYKEEIEYASNKMDLADAHFLFGKMYDNGIEMVQDKEMANTLYKKAHDLKNEMGTFQLGLNHVEKKEFLEAIKLFDEAEKRTISRNKDSHNCLALNNLAYVYSHDEYLQKDLQKSKVYFKLGESYGNTICASNLGLMYLKGCFGKTNENFIYGKKLIQEAAQKGNVHAIDLIKKYDLNLF